MFFYFAGNSQAMNVENENCLNCGYTVSINYCEQCGQATYIPKETLWRMITHFIAQYFNYNSKLWATLKTLIIKPGKLAIDYQNNVRKKNIPPVSLYITVSLLFFILFSFAVKFAQITKFEKQVDGGTLAFINYYHSFGRSGFKEIKKAEITQDKWFTVRQMSNIDSAIADLKYYNDKRPTFFKDLSEEVGDGKLALTIGNAQYVLYNYFVIPYMYRNSIVPFDDGMTITVEKFFHVIPKVFFVLMPLFAAMLFLFFFKKGKRLLFVDHAVMSLHIHVFLFLCVGFQLGLGSFLPLYHINEAWYFWILSPLVYLIIACRNFYGKSWAYTIIMGTITWSIYLMFILLISLTTWLLMIQFG